MGEALDAIVSHKFVETNGIKLHYVEAGSGPTVLLLHGFPDFWYGWRRQIPALVDAGFHVVVPDIRGYGQTDIPTSVEEYTFLHVAGDLVGLLDALQVKQIVVVGHDWGSGFATNLALFRPDLVKAVVLIGSFYAPRQANADQFQMLRSFFGDNLYIHVFQEPGVAEGIFGKAKEEDVMSAFLLRWNDDKQHLSIPKFIADEPLPKWLTKEELSVYGNNFKKTGWTGGLNHYRCFHKSWELTVPWTNARLPPQIPILSLMGRQDIIATFAGIKDAQGEEAFIARAHMITPNLKGCHFIDASHFMHQEKHEEVNKFLLDFLHQYA